MELGHAEKYKRRYAFVYEFNIFNFKLYYHGKAV